MAAYSLRLYRDQDAEALASIIHASILGIGPRAYSPAQVAAWAARHPGPDRFRERVGAGDLIFVAADDDDNAAAYALLQTDGHLDHLYCHPDHTRQGLAEKLLAMAEDHARASGITRLYTEASELARSAFERAGYSVMHRRDFSIEHEGVPVPIHNYAMEKELR